MDRDLVQEGRGDVETIFNVVQVTSRLREVVRAGQDGIVGAAGALGTLVQAFHHVPATGDILLQHNKSGLSRLSGAERRQLFPLWVCRTSGSRPVVLHCSYTFLSDFNPCRVKVQGTTWSSDISSSIPFHLPICDFLGYRALEAGSALTVNVFRACNRSKHAVEGQSQQLHGPQLQARPI